MAASFREVILASLASWTLALARFGLGARPGDGARSGDPREALRAELQAPDVARLDDSYLPGSREILVAVFDQERRENGRKQAEAIARLSATQMPEPNLAAFVLPMAPAEGAAAMKPEPRIEQKFFHADASARFMRALSVELGFVERLVAFWSNHFCVSVSKGGLDRSVAGAFEREAIRGHLLGRFAEMLRAVEQHPAMLSFLDNAQSAGPNSELRHGRDAGLNENLAREILELHTMGVGSGYTQADVTQLAYILTGWSIGGRNGRAGEPGAFAFDARAHEPLAAEVRGRLYLQDGVEQGEAALDDLAREPATADHIAFKLARHFVADDPPPALTQRLAKTFRDSGGDLKALALALIDSDEAWAAPRAKLRNPWELSVASWRAVGRDLDDIRPILNALNLLGQPLWQPAGPNGFPDVSAAWSSPESIKMRVELAQAFANGVKSAPRPEELLHDVLGPGVGDDTRQTVLRAESQEQAYALLLLAPEFQRR
jgi:uncharacterized protein (DUF1800 family)